MITFKGKLTDKEKLEVSEILTDLIDLYGDFYITRNNLRLFIKENIDLLFDCLNKGDKIAYGREGIALVTGYSDKSPRKYVKILARDEESADKLLKIINWNINTELYCKLKKVNPLRYVFLNNNFIFRGNRGKELLLMKRSKGDKNAIRNKD